MTRYAYSYLNGTTDTGLRQSVIDSVANTTTTYTYDGVNRLTRAQTTPNTGGTGNPSDYQYGYDATGNRTSTTIGGAGAAASFNEADEQTDWNTGQDRTYTYDANGNETGSSANESRAYNSRNQTVSITGLNGIPTGMGYLDGGQGERATAGGSAYVNDSLGVASKTKGGQTTYYTRTPSGHLVSQRTPTATYYYLFDGLGSVVGMVDPFGNVAARYGYDPYGQTVTKTGPDNNPGYLTIADGNPFRYTGAYLDSTGLYKMGERYYDPARGRFTQLDPLGDGYRYAGDNPINATDSTGLISIGVTVNVSIDLGVGHFGFQAGVSVAYDPTDGWSAGVTATPSAGIAYPANVGGSAGVGLQIVDVSSVDDLRGKSAVVGVSGGELVDGALDYVSGDGVQGIDIIAGVGGSTTPASVFADGSHTFVWP